MPKPQLRQQLPKNIFTSLKASPTKDFLLLLFDLQQRKQLAKAFMFLFSLM